jgi:hypothetical protein
MSWSILVVVALVLSGEDGSSGSSGSFSTAASGFNASTIHFIWVSPPGKSPFANLVDGNWDTEKPMAKFFQSTMDAWRGLNPQ